MNVSIGLNRPTAEVLANHVADAPCSDINLLDVLVVGTARGYVINVEYELNGESHQRVIRTVEDVRALLSSPREFTLNTSPEIASWEPDLDL